MAKKIKRTEKYLFTVFLSSPRSSLAARSLSFSAESCDWSRAAHAQAINQFRPLSPFFLSCRSTRETRLYSEQSSTQPFTPYLTMHIAYYYFLLRLLYRLFFGLGSLIIYLVLFGLRLIGSFMGVRGNFLFCNFFLDVRKSTS